jgi:hypothetical protein
VKQEVVSAQNGYQTVSSWWKILIPCVTAVAIVVVLLAAGIIGGADPKDSVGDTVRTPNIVGEYYEDAILIAKDAGMLLVITGRENSDAVEPNHILFQTPKARANALRDSTLRSVVSGGMDVPVTPDTMPDVMFAKQGEATAMLDAVGVSYTIEYVTSDTVLDGLVVSQSVSKADTISFAAKPIVLEISTGSEAQDKALAASGCAEIIEQIYANRTARERLLAAYIAYREVLADNRSNVENYVFPDPSIGTDPKMLLDVPVSITDITGDHFPELVAGIIDTEFASKTDAMYPSYLKAYTYEDTLTEIMKTSLYDMFSSLQVVFATDEGNLYQVDTGDDGALWSGFHINKYQSGVYTESRTYSEFTYFPEVEPFGYSEPFISPDGTKGTRTWYSSDGQNWWKEDFYQEISAEMGRATKVLWVDPRLQDSVTTGSIGFWDEFPAYVLAEIENCPNVSVPYDEAIIWLDAQIAVLTKNTAVNNSEPAEPSAESSAGDYIIQYKPVLDALDAFILSPYQDAPEGSAYEFYYFYYNGIPQALSFSYEDYCGYALKDINNNGSPELILIDADYNISSIYSLQNGEPYLLGHYWARNAVCIEDDGTLYTYASGGAANFGLSASILLPDDKTFQLIYGIGVDDSNGYRNPEYYKFTPDSENEISEQEFAAESKKMWEHMDASENRAKLVFNKLNIQTGTGVVSFVWTDAVGNNIKISGVPYRSDDPDDPHLYLTDGGIVFMQTPGTSEWEFVCYAHSTDSVISE